MATTARTPGRDRSGWLRFTRILFTVLVFAPVTVLFIAARGPAVDAQVSGTAELAGVDYLRSLQPLTVALLGAQADAVAGRTPRSSALTEASAAMDLADNRYGDALGLRDRWQGLRTKLQSLPTTGSARTMYVAYDEATDLLLGLYGRLEQTSGLATDIHGDTFSLQRVVAVDLPELTVAIARYADLVQASLGSDMPVAALADLLGQRQAVGRPGRDLVESLQSAVAATSSSTLSGDILGELDSMRLALDAVSAAAGIASNRVSAADITSANTLRTQVAGASAALATKVLDALAELITARRDGARDDASRATLALTGAILAVVVLLGVELVAFLRRPPRDEREEYAASPPRPRAATTRRERVGAAQ